MYNRNQQTARSTTPAESPGLTYLNVFTVEEYEKATARPERNGPRSVPPSPTRRDLASSIEPKSFSDRRPARRLFLRTVTTNSKVAKSPNLRGPRAPPFY